VNTEDHIDEDERIVVVAYIDAIITARKASLQQNRLEVRKVLDLLLETNMFVEIDMCILEQTEASLLGFIVDG
jgi:hypothetical protein